MKLIGAGLPRTGTLSQKVALEMLGVGPCYHMVNVLADLDQATHWRRALEGEANWDEVFGGFQSSVDWPGAFFYRELIETYPDAKVLLSVRSGDGWARSMRDTIWGIFYDEILIRHLSDARSVVDPAWRDYIELMKEMWGRSGLLSAVDTSADWMGAAMSRYNEEVKATVPAERLLVWSAEDGWEPLCEFLEVPVPETPFPHLNDRHQFAERVIDGALLTLRQWRENQRQDDGIAEVSSAG